MTPRQIHGIPIASSDFMTQIPEGGPPQTGWHAQGGWGMLQAHRALKLRYQIRDDQLACGQQKTWGCFTTPRMTMEYAKLRQPWAHGHAAPCVALIQTGCWFRFY